jgi:hypothetical protein
VKKKIWHLKNFSSSFFVLFLFQPRNYSFMYYQKAKRCTLILANLFIYHFGLAQCAFTTTVFPCSCSPGNDGKIIVTLPSLSCFSGATAYNVLVNSPSGCGPVTGLTNVSAGTHTIFNVPCCTSQYGLLLFDQNSNFLGNTNVAVVQSLPTSFTTGAQSPKCNGACSGSIQLSIAGGTSPYSYTVNPPLGSQSTGSFTSVFSPTNLCAGITTIVVQDALLCLTVRTINMSQPAAIITNSVTTGNLCGGACTAGFSVSPAGGVFPYVVGFSSGGTFSVGSGGTASVTGLCTNTNPVTATIVDANNCTVTASYTVPGPPPLNANFSIVPVSCFGLSDGCISTAITGGTSPYTYIWFPSGANTASVCGISAGNYTLNVIDSHNCSTTHTVTLSQPTALSISLTANNPGCSTCCNGTVQLSTSGGTPPYNYILLPGNISSNSGIFANLCAGSYTVIVNSSSCNDTLTAILFSNVNGLTKIKSEKPVRIYPSPVKNKIIIEAEHSEQLLEVSIYDSSGTLFYENKALINGSEVSLETMSRGIYILILKDQTGETRSLKFIKD